MLIFGNEFINMMNLPERQFQVCTISFFPSKILFFEGWVNVFFPYIQSTDKKGYVKNDAVDWKKGISVDSRKYPRSLSQVPFVWIEGRVGTYKMYFVGGIMGMIQNKNKEIILKISWLIAEKKGENKKRGREENEDVKVRNKKKRQKSEK